MCQILYIFIGQSSIPKKQKLNNLVDQGIRLFKQRKVGAGPEIKCENEGHFEGHEVKILMHHAFQEKWVSSNVGSEGVWLSILISPFRHNDPAVS